MVVLFRGGLEIFLEEVFGSYGREKQELEGREGRPPLTTVRDFSERFCGCFSIAKGSKLC